MKEYYINFISDLKTITFRYKYKKDALEKYNELINECFFPGDCVFLNCVEQLSKYPDKESEV